MRKILGIIAGLFFTVNVALADTLVVYPDAGTGGDTVDGWLSQGEYLGVPYYTLSELVNSTDTPYYSLSHDIINVQLHASIQQNDVFDHLSRGYLEFDTSAVNGDIESATLAIFGASKENYLGDTELHVVSADSSQWLDFNNISFGFVSYPNFNASGYNNISLNSSGISNISNISRFGLRLGWDYNISFTGTWHEGSRTRIESYAADNTGTTQDPSLTVEYTPTLDLDANFFGTNF